MTRGHLYNYWRMTFGEITGEEKWYRVNKWKSKSDQLNEQKWQLVSRHQCWFASCLFHNTTLPSNRPVQLPHSAEHYHSELTTQCWTLPQWSYHTVLSVPPCHTQQSFVTNRSTPPSAATALYQAALSHWFPCFRTTFPTDFIFSIFSDPTFHRFPRWASSRARGRWTSQAPPRRVKLQQRWVTWLCLVRKTNPRRPSFDRRTNLTPTLCSWLSYGEGAVKCFGPVKVGRAAVSRLIDVKPLSEIKPLV